MTFPTQGAKLALAAWLEAHSDFRLSSHASDLPTALKALDASPQPTSYLAQFSRLKGYFNRAVLGLLMVAFLLGLMAVPPAFATGESNQVNIFWLLIILLGFHGLNFVVWLVTIMATMRRQTESQGMLLSLLIFLNKKLSKYSHIHTEVSAAYLHWQCPAHSNKWLVSGVSHGAWACYLLAGWIMTLLLLLTNQVNFVWETTLLSDHAFLQLTQALSLLPQWFGVAVPNQVDILASRVDLMSQSASTRQHWANFLLASIAIYGVLPRLLFMLVSLAMYHFKRARQPLSTQEQIILNRYQQAENQNRTVLDADPSPTQTLSRHANTKDYTALPRHAFSQRWALFEWSSAQPECLNTARSLTCLNSREEQEAFLRSSSNDTIYLLVDGEQSPDRGSRRFFSQASKVHPSLFMVISNPEQAKFTDDWQRLAREVQMTVTSLTQKE